jgi:glycosyltransferase involved in cell wall biosynthesis
VGSHLISFIVPCYNYGRFLSDCLNSILQQPGGYRLEAIVVDDASTDETQTVLSGFRDSRLRVIRHTTNLGHVSALRAGFAAAQGDYLARLDADDRYRPNFLTTLVPRLEAHPEAGMACAEASLIDDEGRITTESGDRFPLGYESLSNLLIPLLQKNITCAATAVGRREAWEGALPQPGEYRGKANDDWYYNVMIARNWDHYFVNEVVADVRIHKQNLHYQVMLDRSEEEFVFWFLDWIFAHPERDAAREDAKQRIRARAYGEQYLTLAAKYFGLHMNADARRCYSRAIRFHPGYLRRPDVVRLWAASAISRSLYERAKAFVKRVRTG